MKILIVDDNANNRLVLKLLLEQYQELNEGLKFAISEAVDGQEAIDMCVKESFDIVFMDIMMPNIDGVEATKVIKESDASIMIIAVSAVDDAERMKLILNYGAEDYIPKPVNADLFMNRITNYFSIIKSRERKVIENKNYRNVYSSNVYNRFTKFVITSDESLAEFWECFLLNPREKFDNVSDVIRTLFSIAEAQLQLAGKSFIYIEESQEYQYFTIVDIDVLPIKVIELIIKKSQSNLEYKIQDNKLSFQLEKINTMVEIEEGTKTSLSEVISPKEDTVSSPIQAMKKSATKLEIFDYMDEDDMLDLEEYAAKLSSLMLMVGSGDITAQEVEEIYTYLDRLGQILSTYSEIYPISLALSSLASAMQEHQEAFIENSQAIGPMCKAFSNDMSSWIQMSFYTGAPSVDFMNDTIAVNTKTIESMLTMDDNNDGSEDLDDIFDF